LLNYDTNAMKDKSIVEIVKHYEKFDLDNIKCKVSYHDFSKNDILIRNQGYKSKEIIIEDDVWIASNVFIGKGIRIGKGAIIGAGAVVVNDVEENTIVAGIPAKKIKNRF